MKYSKEFKIGLFAVLVGTVAFLLLNYLRGNDIFNREQEYIGYFDNIETLTVSAPVLVKGYKAGQVTEIEYQTEEGNFRVCCSVKKDFRVPVDSRLVLFSTSIMGGKGIEVQMGSSDQIAEDEAVLETGSVADLLTSLGNNIGPVMENLASVMDSLKVTVAGVNRLLCEENRKSVERTLASLDRTIASASSLMNSLNGKSAELESFIDNLKIMSDKLAPVMDKVDSTVGNLNTITASLGEADIKAMVESANSLLDRIQDPDGTLGRLMKDDSVYDSVDELVSDLDKLIKAIQENPKKYMKISVF